MLRSSLTLDAESRFGNGFEAGGRDVAIDLGQIQIDDEVRGGVNFGVACTLHEVLVLFAFVLVELAADFVSRAAYARATRVPRGPVAPMLLPETPLRICQGVAECNGPH